MKYFTLDFKKPSTESYEAKWRLLVAKKNKLAFSLF